MSEPAWLTIARGELGVHETPGPTSTARIAAYHATCTLRATSDEVPWCSAFVNWCLRQAGYHGTDSALAASWLTWGMSDWDAQCGCIAVLKHRTGGDGPATGSGTGYHVGFLLAADLDRVTVLGGNQHDAVTVARFRRRDYIVRAVRWPRPADQRRPDTRAA